MRVNDLQDVFKNKGPFLQNKPGICSQWKDFPPKPAVYLLVVDEPFECGHNKTDIIYIGKTKHFGSKPQNNRLWDYHTRATPHEQNIVNRVKELDSESSEPVKIYWCYGFPHGYTYSEYEKHLLKCFKKEHGKLPRLNKSI